MTATVWVINTSSRHYDFFVVAESEAKCMRTFARMWNDWCKHTGADPYYWGEKGDKWAEVDCVEVDMNTAYMDREVYRHGP